MNTKYEFWVTGCLTNEKEELIAKYLNKTHSTKKIQTFGSVDFQIVQNFYQITKPITKIILDQTHGGQKTEPPYPGGITKFGKYIIKIIYI